MALGKDIKKIINSNVEISKVLHQGKVIWQSGLDLSDPNLWEKGGLDASSGEPLAVSYRIRTPIYYSLESSVTKIQINSGYSAGLSYYKDDDTFISYSVRGGSQTVTAPVGATKFKPSIGKVNGNNLTVQEAISANLSIEFL